MTINDSYRDSLLRRLSVFGDYSKTQQRAIVKLMSGYEERILQDLVKAYKNEGVSLTSLRQFQKQLSSINLIHLGLYKKIYSLTEKEITGIFKSEYQFQKAFFKKNLNIGINLTFPNKEKVLTAIQTRPLDGKPFFYKRVSDGKSWLSDLFLSETSRFNRVVTQSFISGENLGQAISRVRGTRAAQYKDGVFTISKNNARSVVRTALQGMQNSSQELVLQNLKTRKEIYSAILDGRTTPVCGQLDGNVYNFDEGPRPPQHFGGCRSIRLPFFNGDILGQRTYITDTRRPDKRLVDFRRNAKANVGADKWKQLSPTQRKTLIAKERTRWARQNIGTVPVKTNYNDWFSTQNATFQRHRLGAGRYKIFKESNLQFNDLVNKNGKFYNVGQLNNFI